MDLEQFVLLLKIGWPILVGLVGLGAWIARLVTRVKILETRVDILAEFLKDDIKRALSTGRN